MRIPYIWRQISLLLIGFILINVFAKLFMNNGIVHLRLNAIKSYPAPSHLFVGNSVVEAGVNIDVIKSGFPLSRPLNIGLGSAQMSDASLLMQQVTTLSKTSRIYLGFFDRALTDEETSNWSDLMANRSTCYLTDLDTATELIAKKDPILKWQMRLTAFSPILVERGSLWGRVEVLRRKVGEIGLPKQATNAFGRVEDFSNLQEKDIEKFAEKCQIAATERSPFNASVNRMIEQAKRAKATLYFVQMPMTSKHRRLYNSTRQWEKYQIHIQKFAAQSGVKYIDASNWVADRDFSDFLHLSPSGASLFTRKLLPPMRSDVLK